MHALARPSAQYSMSVVSGHFQNPLPQEVALFLLQMEKLRHGEVKCFNIAQLLNAGLELEARAD